MDQEQYFVFIPGEGSQGPFSPRGLELLAGQKKINAETLVCPAGEKDWKPYGEAFRVVSRPVPITPAPRAASNGTAESTPPDSSLDEEIEASGGSWVVSVLIYGGGLICLLAVLAGILIAVSDAPTIIKVYALMGVPCGILSGACLAAFGYLVRYQNIIIQCQRVIIRCERGCLRMLGDLVQK